MLLLFAEKLQRCILLVWLREDCEEESKESSHAKSHLLVMQRSKFDSKNWSMKSAVMVQLGTFTWSKEHIPYTMHCLNISMMKDITLKPINKLNMLNPPSLLRPSCQLCLMTLKHHLNTHSLTIFSDIYNAVSALYGTVSRSTFLQSIWKWCWPVTAQFDVSYHTKESGWINLPFDFKLAMPIL